MTKIRYILTDGSVIPIDADVDTSVMENATWNDVPGILAICGGSLACGTCHVYVDPADADRMPVMSEDEADMLDFVAAERRETSRLSCQLVMDGTEDAVTVYLPECQE